MYTDQNRRVSIVEDNHSFQQMLKDFIERKFPGIHIDAYSTGEDFLNKYTNDADAVLLDYSLDSVDRSSLNGLQILKILKQRDRDSQVIFLSATDSAELADSVINNGAYHYVVKNEHAFARVEIILRNLFHQAGIRKNLKTQRFFNTVLVIMLLLLLLGLLFRRLGV